jgi:hypothetical protein
MIGTQSRHVKSQQVFVETTMQGVMDSTGFSNCKPAVDFLKRFWQTTPDTVVDWRQLARQEAKHGKHFLVI